MAAVFSWAQASGPLPGVIQDRGSYGLLFSFKNIDEIGSQIDEATAITPDGPSFELWLALHFPEAGYTVSDVRLWLPFPLDPGLTLLFNGQQVNYAEPVDTVSTIATATLPANDLGAANVSIDGNLNGSLVTPGYTDFIVLQLVVDPTYAKGYLDPIALAVSYADVAA